MRNPNCFSVETCKKVNIFSYNKKTATIMSNTMVAA